MVLSTGMEFDEWLRAPLVAPACDPHFEIRRAQPDDFEEIYEVVDEAFHRRRPRSYFDWLYRRNPLGLARCLITIERTSGRIVGSEARCSWPIAKGAELIPGELTGDAAFRPEFQRRGVRELVRPFRHAHPWHRQTTRISWPNEKSRGASKKHGRGFKSMGPLPTAVLPLCAQGLAQPLLRRGWPRSIGSLAGRAGVAALGAWQQRTLVHGGDLRVEPVQSFDASFDSPTDACMRTHDFWSPRDATFLNWRYFDHPVHDYAALAVLNPKDEPEAYGVVRIQGETALLMEFVAPSSGAPGLDLLHSLIEVSRRAGCARLEFFSTPRWPHWSLFRRAGFFNRGSEIYMSGHGRFEPDVYQIANWLIVPGDCDVC